MVTKITDGVKISVETIYQPEYSNLRMNILCSLTGLILKI
jgi:hypothetical protein